MVSLFAWTKKGQFDLHAAGLFGGILVRLEIVFEWDTEAEAAGIILLLQISRFELADEGRYKEARGKQSGKRLLAVDGQSLYVDQTRTVWLTCDVVGLFGQMERQG